MKILNLYAGIGGNRELWSSEHSIVAVENNKEIANLYQEIIFLQNFFKGKFCVENVKSYYEPLIKPQHIGRHYLWANFSIPKISQPKKTIGNMMQSKGNVACKKPLVERNAVDSKLGLHILNRAMNIITSYTKKQNELF